MSQHRAQPMAALTPSTSSPSASATSRNVAAPDVVGPWRIREAEGRFHLFREWERFEMGHTPAASFSHREDALLFGIGLCACGGPALFRVREGGPVGPEGYLVERESQLVGTVKTDRAELLVIAHALAGGRADCPLSSLSEASCREPSALVSFENPSAGESAEKGIFPRIIANARPLLDGMRHA